MNEDAKASRIKLDQFPRRKIDMTNNEGDDDHDDHEDDPSQGCQSDGNQEDCFVFTPVPTHHASLPADTLVIAD